MPDSSPPRRTTPSPIDRSEAAAPTPFALAVAVEPFAGSVYFAPEAHRAYQDLGHRMGPGAATKGWLAAHWGTVERPDGTAYFCSRGSMLGQVSGGVVAAAFGVFSPAVVVSAVETGWRIASADQMFEARDRGALAQLVRVLGHRPEGLTRVVDVLETATVRLETAGRPMFAGLAARERPRHPLALAWRLADQLREYRGDAFVGTWAAEALGGCDVQVLTERVAGMPPHTYSATRGWTREELTASEQRLTQRGLLADGAPTTEGRAVRERMEQATDRACLPLLADLTSTQSRELVATLTMWGRALREAGAYYPSSPQQQVERPGPDFDDDCG